MTPTLIQIIRAAGEAVIIIAFLTLAFFVLGALVPTIPIITV